MRRSPFAWSLVDQGLASGTTLIFIGITARTLGPAGLGTVALGYATLLIALGFERAVIVDPLLTRIQTSVRSGHEALEAAVSATVSGSLLLAILALVVGLSATGAAARGMLIFSPWIVPALTHTLLKAWLYREGRARTATASSAIWLGIMLCAMAAGLRWTDWQITAAWGLGACAAVALAAAGTKQGVRAAGARSTSAWFVHEALGVGLWRALSSVLSSVAGYAFVAGISSILGPAAVGGYRAIEAVFAPASLIGPAFMSSGLPALRNAVEHRAAAVWRLAVKISLFSCGLLVAYVLAVFLARDPVISIFGTGFSEYEYLIPPLMVGQLLAAVGLGFGLLLVAARRVREIVVLTTLHAVLMLGLALPLAAARGLEAAAWGIAAAPIVPVILTVALARRTVRAVVLPARQIAGIENAGR